MDRREFLGYSAMGAAGGVATWLAADVRALRAAESPSEKLTIAVIGTNGRGSDLATDFAAESGTEIAYICDPDSRAITKGLAAVAKHQERVPKTVADFREALDDQSLDAVVIATPDHWHAPATILACAAGKHVYCEKPACHNGQEGQWMVAAARQHKRHVQLGTQRRSAPSHMEVVRRVQAGEIGRVLFARGWINSTRPNIGHGKPVDVPAELNFDLWQGPALERPYVDNLVHYNWHWFWNWGTGELGNNGIHALDVCRWGLGVDYPQRITCGGGRLHFDDDQETPDTQIATFHFKDASGTEKVINWEHRTWNRRGIEGEMFGVAFYGESGSLVLTNRDVTIFDLENKEVHRSGASYSNQAHIANFLETVRGKGTLNAEIEEGVKSTALCHLGNIAYRSGQTVIFDPATQQVQGDSSISQLWGREYRTGWQPQV